MLLRSMLYVPANNIKLINKAQSLSMDAVVLDLEDSVPLQEKEEARSNIRQCLGGFKKQGRFAFVRVNSVKTELTEDDLTAVVCKELDGILLAKAETEEEVDHVDSLLTSHEADSRQKPGRIKMVPLIESAVGVIHVYAIAKSSLRIVAVAFGAGDYMRDLGLDISSVSTEQTELLYARSKIVNVCKAAGIAAIDTPYLLSLKDTDRFLNEVAIACGLGFNGKQCIHPNQLGPVNQAFSPSQDKVSYSLRLVEAFESAESQGFGAVSFEGKMVDRMNYAQAKQLLERAKEISEKDA